MADCSAYRLPSFTLERCKTRRVTPARQTRMASSRHEKSRSLRSGFRNLRHSRLDTPYQMRMGDGGGTSKNGNCRELEPETLHVRYSVKCTPNCTFLKQRLLFFCKAGTFLLSYSIMAMMVLSDKAGAHAEKNLYHHIGRCPIAVLSTLFCNR